MNYCANCGHQLGVGRFCTNCGTPVPGRHPSAPVRTGSTPAAADPPTRATPAPPATGAHRSGAPSSPPPSTPPASRLDQAATQGPVTPKVGSAPPAARYPLYADAPLGAAPPTSPPSEPPTAAVATSSYDHGRTRRRGGPLLVLAVVLALLVVAGAIAAFSLINNDDHGRASDPTTQRATPSRSGSRSPSPSGGASHGGKKTDLADEVEHIQVPGTSPASTDLSGNPVTFASDNMVDGDPQTAWRVPGDATGKTVTITFARPVKISEVGMINGYAKKYPGYNGYRLNRRILSVRWEFDDGTSVDQDLDQARDMQTTAITARRTSSLRLQIVSVSTGKGGKDETAISELALKGSAG